MDHKLQPLTRPEPILPDPDEDNKAPVSQPSSSSQPPKNPDLALPTSKEEGHHITPAPPPTTETNPSTEPNPPTSTGPQPLFHDELRYDLETGSGLQTYRIPHPMTSAWLDANWPRRELSGLRDRLYMLNEWKRSLYTQNGSKDMSEAERAELGERERSAVTVDQWRTANSASWNALGNYGVWELEDERKGCCGGCVIL